LALFPVSESRNRGAKLSQEHRYVEVDALRGIAALTVLFYHVLGHRVVIVFGAAEQPRGIFDRLTIDAVVSAIVTTILNGSAAVVLFFVISGFVLAASIEKTPIPTPSAYLSFLVRRLFRLMPGVWLSLGVMIAIFCYYNAMPPPFTTTPMPSLWTIINAFWLGDGIFAVNAPLWSIRIELVISAMFPALVLVNWLGGRIGSFVIALMLTVMTWRGDLPNWFLFLLAFQLGIMLPTFGAPMIRVVPLRLRPWILLIVFSIFSGSLNMMRLQIWDERIWIVIKSVTAFYILSHIVYGPQIRFLRSSWAQQLGKMSFGIYLFHGPLMFVGISFWFGLLPNGFASQTVAFGCLVLIGVLPATLLLAWASYEWVERPCIRWGRLLAATVLRLDPHWNIRALIYFPRVPSPVARLKFYAPTRPR
jgi:peptidoglycan/LPS O-acetylase OafA/YrhL